MKKLLVLAILFTAQGIFAQEADIKKSIRTFFDGLHARDTVMMKSVAYKHLILESITEFRGQGKFDFEMAENYYSQVSKISPEIKIEERILSYKIQVDGTLAHVWTPYEFYANGKLSHTGVNSFQLFKDEGIWKIIYLVDTRRTASK